MKHAFMRSKVRCGPMMQRSITTHCDTTHPHLPEDWVITRDTAVMAIGEENRENRRWAKVRFSDQKRHHRGAGNGDADAAVDATFSGHNRYSAFQLLYRSR